MLQSKGKALIKVFSTDVNALEDIIAEFSDTCVLELRKCVMSLCKNLISFAQMINYLLHIKSRATLCNESKPLWLKCFANLVVVRICDNEN